MKYKIFIIILLLSLPFVLVCKSNSKAEQSNYYGLYLKKAEHYAIKGEPKKAISEYKKAIDLNPQDAKAHFALGKLYASEWKKSYDLAFKKYVYGNHYNIRNKKEFILELEKLGLKQEYKNFALQEFKKTLKISPKNLIAREYIATYYLNNKNFNGAISQYRIIIKINSNISIIYWHIADAYLHIGSYDNAINSINKAFNIDKDSEYYYYRLGQVYYKMGNNKKSFDMLSKLKKLKSIYYDKLFNYIYYGG